MLSAKSEKCAVLPSDDRQHCPATQLYSRLVRNKGLFPTINPGSTNYTSTTNTELSQAYAAATQFHNVMSPTTE